MSPSSQVALAAELLGQQGFLRRLALDLVGRPDDADDLVQEVNLSALERPPSDVARLRGWLVEVVGRVAARSRWRAAMRCERERDAARAELLEPVEHDIDTARVLLDALASLPDTYRHALLLRYWRDRSPLEIARDSGVPLETVKSRLARGRAALRTELERRSKSRATSWSSALAALAWPHQGWLAILVEPFGAALRRWRVQLAGGAATALLLGGQAGRELVVQPLALVPAQRSERARPWSTLVPASTIPAQPEVLPATPLEPARDIRLAPDPLPTLDASAIAALMR